VVVAASSPFHDKEHRPLLASMAHTAFTLPIRNMVGKNETSNDGNGSDTAVTASAVAEPVVGGSSSASSVSDVCRDVDVDVDVVGLEEDGARLDLMRQMLKSEKGDDDDDDAAAAAVKRPMKVLFLSSDTGGGHRASAESLAKQFERLYPGSTYDLLDIWTMDGCLPYRTLVPAYKHLSRHPLQWGVVYHISNTRPYEMLTDFHSALTCERKIRRRIASYEPDVVVSVHPTMNNVPIISLKKMEKETGKHVPFFTVVTDFGSGHCTWFHKGVEKVFVASERIRKLAKRRGSVPSDKLVQVGLPIRRAFAEIVDEMGDRTTSEGRIYQRKIRENLNIDPDKKTVLVMGGGEGVGGLSKIVEALYVELMKSGVDCNILVVCGRNEKLRNEIATKDWNKIVETSKKLKRIRHVAFLRYVIPNKRVRSAMSRALKQSKEAKLLAKAESSSVLSKEEIMANVNVTPLGFVTNMADYMVASDILISKAGPGTIAEAAAVGLPIMITSYLPGQEAGNVDVVLDGGFGEYKVSPPDIAEGVSSWLQDEDQLLKMSQCAYAVGAPHASEEIVLAIGESTQQWMQINDETADTRKRI